MSKISSIQLPVSNMLLYRLLQRAEQGQKYIPKERKSGRNAGQKGIRVSGGRVNEGQAKSIERSTE